MTKANRMTKAANDEITADLQEAIDATRIDIAALALLNEMALQSGYAPFSWEGLTETQRYYYRRCVKAVKDVLDVET